MANVANMRLWVDALRSGLYEQTTGKLSDGDNYCCLGVLCEVAIANGVEVDKERRSEQEGLIVLYDGSGGVLPRSVSEWLDLGPCCQQGGCNQYADTVRVEGGTMSVVSLNDSRQWTFEQIADAVEEEYLRD